MTPPTPPTLSIVMPVLNEAAGLRATLQALAPFTARGAELIVADGGSTDASVALAHAGGALVVLSPRSRALQLNAGAQQARGGVLLFLHADTVLPAHADLLITRALAHGPALWGRFDVLIEGRSPLLRVVAALMNWRSRWTGIATGDQAMFMTREARIYSAWRAITCIGRSAALVFLQISRYLLQKPPCSPSQFERRASTRINPRFPRDAFDAAGGFPAQPLMEDIEMSKRLRRVSRPACLRDRVLTSGRRWEARGVWRTVLLMWRLRLAYWCGSAPESLAERYR